MIDLHCHILPNIDDGPKSIEQSLKMASVLEQSGYKQVVATPHAVPGTHWMPSPASIRERVAELNQALRDESIQVTIIYWTVSWLSGIWLASNVHVPWFFWLVPIVLGILCAITLWKRALVRSTSICFVIVGLCRIIYPKSVLGILIKC